VHTDTRRQMGSPEIPPGTVEGEEGHPATVRTRPPACTRLQTAGQDNRRTTRSPPTSHGKQPSTPKPAEPAAARARDAFTK
jgi:hypothetical protein